MAVRIRRTSSQEEWEEEWDEDIGDDWLYSGDISAYAGFWEYPDGTVLEIENDTWYLYEADEHMMIAWGPVEFDADAAYLMNDDGSSGGVVYFDEDGDLIGSSGGVLTYLGLSING